jgi:hypothetical protein
MIIYTHQKSKKRKPTVKQRKLQADWEELIQKYAPKNVKKTQFSAPKNVAKPYVRETEYIPSLNTGYYNTFRKPDMYYTGDNMKGIGTLHKSNAVPIFTDEEAKDQANMRR